MLLYGLEGILDKRKIKGEMNNQQKVRYHIARGQFVGGIMLLLCLIYILFHLHKFLNSN